MFISLRTITLPTAAAGATVQFADVRRKCCAQLPGVVSNLVEPALAQAAINAGHIIWRMAFNSEREAYQVSSHVVWQSCIQPLPEGTEVTGVHYRNVRSDVIGGGTDIWRALIFRINPAGIFPDPLGRRRQVF